MVNELRAVIFDFNGIILDDEPLHFRSMRDVVAAFGPSLSQEEYWDRYLPFDDETCLDAICRDHSLQLTAGQRKEALRRKSELYHMMLRDQYPLFPGAAALIQSASQKYPMAIASGARREDIERTLLVTGLAEFFKVVVGAEDFALGKPHPESFLLALARLNDHLNGQGPPVRPPECLVIEDSIGGIRGARAAGMICLAVANTYPRERLNEAHRVVASLEEIDVGHLESIAREGS